MVQVETESRRTIKLNDGTVIFRQLGQDFELVIEKPGEKRGQSISLKLSAEEFRALHLNANSFDKAYREQRLFDLVQPTGAASSELNRLGVVLEPLKPGENGEEPNEVTKQAMNDAETKQNVTVYDSPEQAIASIMQEQDADPEGDSSNTPEPSPLDGILKPSEKPDLDADTEKSTAKPIKKRLSKDNGRKSLVDQIGVDINALPDPGKARQVGEAIF